MDFLKLTTMRKGRPHVHPEEEKLQLLVMIQAVDYSQVMERVRHLVVRMNDPQKGFWYLDLALGFYKVDAANSSCINRNFSPIILTYPQSSGRKCILDKCSQCKLCEVTCSLLVISTTIHAQLSAWKVTTHYLIWHCWNNLITNKHDR